RTISGSSSGPTMSMMASATASLLSSPDPTRSAESPLRTIQRVDEFLPGRDAPTGHVILAVVLFGLGGRLGRIVADFVIVVRDVGRFRLFRRLAIRARANPAAVERLVPLGQFLRMGAQVGGLFFHRGRLRGGLSGSASIFTRTSASPSAAPAAAAAVGAIVGPAKGLALSSFRVSAFALFDATGLREIPDTGLHGPFDDLIHRTRRCCGLNIVRQRCWLRARFRSWLRGQYQLVG